MLSAWQEEEILILIKAYPNPSKGAIETSCTAGITRGGQLIRLYPIAFRLLEEDKRFSKYQWIKVRIRKANDPRPESYVPDFDSIEIISDPIPTKNKWELRRGIVESCRMPSMEAIRNQQEETGISLAFFRPRQITALHIEQAPEKWTNEELAKLQQQNFFDTGNREQLERVPFDFKYEYLCDDPACRGHKMKIVDWEIYQAYRSWLRKYGSGWEEKLRHRFEYEMQEKKDTHFFVGTMRSHPTSWIIVGLFYPPN